MSNTVVTFIVEHPLDEGIKNGIHCDECKIWFDNGKEYCKNCDFDFSIYNKSEKE